MNDLTTSLVLNKRSCGRSEVSSRVLQHPTGSLHYTRIARNLAILYFTPVINSVLARDVGVNLHVKCGQLKALELQPIRPNNMDAQ
jgi:hypothetical protein